jgi:cytochrome c-type biogenesis protein CcmE
MRRRRRHKQRGVASLAFVLAMALMLTLVIAGLLNNCLHLLAFNQRSQEQLQRRCDQLRIVIGEPPLK